MKSFLQKIGFIAYGSLIYALPVAAANPVDGVIAVVGDSVILKSELDAYAMMRLANVEPKPDSSEIAKLRARFLEELIDGKVLVVHAGRDTNIVIKESDVEQALNNQVQMILRQNNISMSVLEQELREKYGMTLTKFKAQMRPQINEQLIRQRVQQLYVTSMPVNRADVESFYRQYGDSMPKLGESILLSKLTIKTAATDSVRQAAYAKIRLIKQRLDNGDDFSEVAKKHSEDPSAENGGDLGFIEKGTLSDLRFEERAFALDPGATSDIFESRIGFHIVKVTEKKDKMAHVLWIFVKVLPPDDAVAAARARLDSIRSACTGKQDFVVAVRQWSTDNVSKANGGRMGWMSVYELSSPIKTAVDSLQPGQISSIVNDDGENSIYRCDDRVEQRAMTMEDDYAVLAEKTKEIGAQKKLIDLVRKWRQEVFVEERL
jgi:peptidyl-prolyl cis-trans isomerase SurA